MSFNKQNAIFLDASQVKKLEQQLRRASKELDKKQNQRLVDEALRKSVKPWQSAVNNGWMYKFVKRRSGDSANPFGNTKVNGKRRGIYGRRVGPKGRGKSAGWRAHFFASPAKQIKSGMKIPFFNRFRSKNAEVAALVNVHISKLVRQLARKVFK